MQSSKILREDTHTYSAKVVLNSNNKYSGEVILDIGVATYSSLTRKMCTRQSETITAKFWFIYLADKYHTPFIGRVAHYAAIFLY